MNSLAHHMRQIMCIRDNQTLAQIHQHVAMPCTRQQLSSLLATEIGAHRATRHGERGTYTYSLTATGIRAAKDPAWLHSRFNRRHRGRHGPSTPTAA